MDHIPVKGSSNISSYSYDPASRALEIKFLNGGHYSYADVPQEVYDGLVKADSKGGFLSASIRGKFSHSRLGGK